MFIASYILLVPPTWIIDKQLAALSAGDIPKAYSYTSDAFQRDNSFDEFKAFMDGVPALYDSHGIIINEEMIDKTQNNALIVKGFLRASDNKQIPIEYAIVRSSDIEEIFEGWKIQTIKIQDQGTWKILSIKDSN